MAKHGTDTTVAEESEMIEGIKQSRAEGTITSAFSEPVCNRINVDGLTVNHFLYVPNLLVCHISDVKLWQKRAKYIIELVLALILVLFLSLLCHSEPL